MMYSPGHNRARSLALSVASSRVCAFSTKCRLPSPSTLKMLKGRGIQTPDGDDLLGGTVKELSHQFSELGTGCATYQGVQRGFRGVGFTRGESSGPWTASLTAMKSLTTSWVFEESMPIPINVCWRRLAKPALLVPVLRITSTMHSRIAVVWALFGCLPINSRVSLSVKFTTTGHGGRSLSSANLIITCASPWLR